MNIVLLLIQALPSLLQAILSIESVFPDKAGADKKQMVLAPLQQVLGSAHEAIPAISGAVDGLVGALNATGLWPKGAAALGKVTAAVPQAAAIVSSLESTVNAMQNSQGGQG